MLPFLIFLFVIALIGMLVLVVMQHSDRTKLDPQVHDTTNTILQKVPLEVIEKIKNGQAVSFGTCTQTKQEVWQAASIRKQNTFFLGPNGVGKTAHVVATALKQDIERGDNAVIWFEGKSDPKLIGLIQDLCIKANRELVIFPFDKGYNPLNIGDSPKIRAAMFSYMIRLAKEGVSKDADFFTGEMVKFVNLIVPIFEYVKGIAMIPEELKILCNNKKRRKELLDQAKGSTAYRNYDNTYGDTDDKEFNMVLKSIATIIDNLYAEMKNEGRFDLYNTRDAKGGITAAIDRKAVIIIAEGGNKGSAEHDRGMIYLAELFSYTRSRKTKHDVCLYMDELHYYLIPSFTQFQATSRGANVIQILGFQSFAMLRALSPEAEESIKTNCRTWIVHNDINYDDAEEVSKKTTLRPHKTYSRSENMDTANGNRTEGVHLEDKYLIPPYQIQYMNPNQVLYLSITEERGKAPSRFLIKPPILDDSKFWYTPPTCASLDILTVWEEEEVKMLEEEKNKPKPVEEPVKVNSSEAHGQVSKKDTVQQKNPNQGQGRGNNPQGQKNVGNPHRRVKQKKQNGLPNVGEI